LICLFYTGLIKSEGTKQLAPNPNTLIADQKTNDIAALHINSPSYNNFASWKNKNPESRLHIHISDPKSECIFLGFSAAHLVNDGNIQDVEYWIYDPNGREVLGGVQLYDGAEEIDNWQEAVEGPRQLRTHGGYNATYVSSEDLISNGWNGPGDYYIEFRNKSTALPFLIDYFDITVVSCTSDEFVEKPGRVWAYNWALFAINDFGFPVRPFNGAFYICAPDQLDITKSFITKIDFNDSGFRPAAFNFAFNSFGADTTGVIFTDRQSVENRNQTYWEYPIYLNDPIDVCDEGDVGDAKIKSIRRCDDNGFEFSVLLTGHGQVQFLLDFDKGDGIYTPESKDVILVEEFTVVGPDTLVFIYWDGFDGLGNNYNNLLSGEIPTKLLYGQSPFHFPIYDGEFLSKGFNVDEVRPRSFKPIKLFYDDSNISEDSGTNIPKTELLGCEPPCHNWNNYISANSIGFGNRNTINTWWYGHQIQEDKTFEIPSYYICDVGGPTFICEGDTLKIFARPQLTPLNGERHEITGFSWSGENIIGNPNLSFVEINGGGEYTVEMFWINDGVVCSTFCSYFVEELMSYKVEIDTTITFGSFVNFNNKIYSDAGTYIQNLIAKNGCDSILTINLDVFVPDVLLECELIGDNIFCGNETSVINSIISQSTLQNIPIDIISYIWDGPDIVIDEFESIVIAQGSNYNLTIDYLDFKNQLLSTECEFYIEKILVQKELLQIHYQV